MDKVKRNILYIVWFQVLLAIGGSLFFSEIKHFPPCVLCWYQRIFMYPLAIIIAVGILRKDKKVYYYVLPLAIAGMAVAFYQNLLYYKILPESIAPCTAGVSCTTRFIEWFGFVSIPMLSLISFTFITIGMLVYKRYNGGK